MWYVENEAVKIFLYYMRGGKKFFHYMISCNPVKALGKILYFIYI